MELRDAAKC